MNRIFLALCLYTPYLAYASDQTTIVIALKHQYKTVGTFQCPIDECTTLGQLKKKVFAYLKSGRKYNATNIQIYMRTNDEVDDVTNSTARIMEIKNPVLEANLIGLS